MTAEAATETVRTIRAGDSVLHRPSGETWVVSGVDVESDRLCWQGWPSGSAKLSDCELKESCDDAEHMKTIDGWRRDKESYDQRQSLARHHECELCEPWVSGADRKAFEAASEIVGDMVRWWSGHLRGDVPTEPPACAKLSLAELVEANRIVSTTKQRGRIHVNLDDRLTAALYVLWNYEPEESPIAVGLGRAIVVLPVAP